MQNQKNVTIGIKRNPYILARGEPYYTIQRFLYNLGLINYLKIPFYNYIERGKLFRIINTKSERVICNTHKLGLLLKKIKIPIVSNFKITGSISEQTTDQLHSIMWTLVCSSYVTPSTKKLIKDLIPNDFPVVDI